MIVIYSSQLKVCSHSVIVTAIDLSQLKGCSHGVIVTAIDLSQLKVCSHGVIVTMTLMQPISCDKLIAVLLY